MTALRRLPARRELRAAMMVRDGLGWRVGAGNVVTGRLDEPGEAFADDGAAERAVIALADARDLLALRE